MDDRIAIIYTTFLRYELAKKTFQSIFDVWQDNFTLLAAEQSNDGKGCTIYLKKSPAYLFYLPFDCGVSYARNKLLEQANTWGIKYCILTADSIEFTLDTISHLDQAVQFLKNHPDVGILGFGLKDRAPWEYFMDIQNNCFQLKKNDLIEIDQATGLRFKHCDICRQFFLAKIDTILAVKWDEALKTGEHEDFFWRYKQAGHKVCWTPDITGNYIDFKSANYIKYRNRQYNEFRELLFKKYRLNDWVQYV